MTLSLTLTWLMQASASTSSGAGFSVRIDKLANRVSYKRQLLAIAAVMKALERERSKHHGNHAYGNTGGGGGGDGKGGGGEAAEPSGVLAAALTCVSNGGNADSLEALGRMAVSPYAAAEVRRGRLGRRLNDSQLAAAEAAASQALTLVQGPPGTGKTAVALAILTTWVHCLGGTQILATSDSNIAVDNLLAGLADAGVRVVRLGRPDSVRPELLQYCPDAREKGEFSSKQEEFDARRREIKAAQVVCATCIGVGSEVLKGQSFGAVLVDEATQATEASTLVAFCRGAQQVVLLGDQCQLGPTVNAKLPGSQPLFTRLIDDGLPTLLLDTQYRMHPGIAQLPSDLIYGGRLRSGVSAADRPAAAGFDWPVPQLPVALVPVYGGGEASDGTSKSNAAEAQAVAEVVDRLRRGGVRASEIGVISPYSAQVSLLRRMLRRGGEPQGEQLEISSVDGFQGREKQVIIFSCVRSNNISSTRGALGFLADARRVNVAFTRARIGLIVIGHPPTLQREPGTWAPWLTWARAHGLVMGEAPSGRYDAHATRASSAALMASMAEMDGAAHAAAPGQAVAASRPPAAQQVYGSSRADGYGDLSHDRSRNSRRSRSGSSRSSSSSSSRSRSRSRSREREPPTLPTGWSEAKAPDGRSYFYHSGGGTCWKRPTSPAPGHAPAPVPAAPAAPVLNGRENGHKNDHEHGHENGHSRHGRGDRRSRSRSSSRSSSRSCSRSRKRSRSRSRSGDGRSSGRKRHRHGRDKKVKKGKGDKMERKESRERRRESSSERRELHERRELK